MYEGSMRMIAEMGQSRGNRRPPGVGSAFRLCSSAPVHESHKEDRRTTTVGKGIRGLQHPKTMLVRMANKSYLVIGSANWTSSSRSSVEMGVSIASRSDLKVFTDYAAKFDKIGEEAHLPQGVQPSDG